MNFSEKAHNPLLCAVWVAALTIVSAPLTAGQSPGMSKRDDFSGIWQYPDKYFPNKVTHYLKIVKAGERRFQLTEGVKEIGSKLEPKDTIMWTEPNPYCNNKPIIDLTAIKGRLKGQFVADCFRATHGLDFTYRLNLDLQPRGKMTYSVWSSQDGKHGDSETFQATRVSAPAPIASGTPSRQAGTTQIGLLKDNSPLGCGCSFSQVFPGRKKVFDKYLFISDATGKAYININGRDTVLQEVGRKQARDEGGYCAGKRCTFIGNGVKATVDFHETEKCPPEPTECEITGYDVTITVEQNGIKQRVKGEGSCGC